MATLSQLSQYIESFVDSSKSPTQQGAGLEAIVFLLNNDALTVESLVKELEMYLTTSDDILRARGILLLGEVLARLSSKPLDKATIHSLIKFFSDRLADWRALRGAIVGCSALIRRKSNGLVTGVDAKAVAKSYLENLQVQSLAQHDRKLCFDLLECLLKNYPEDISSLGEDLIYGICEAIDGEKDPHCLIVTFHIVEMLVQLFPDPAGPLAGFVADLFAILGSYFPIHFTHPKAEDIDVKRDDLSRALMLAISSTPLFEPFAIPLLLEKLSSSLPSAKVDSLKYLSCCTSKFGAQRLAKHAGAIWTLLKDAVSSFGEEHVQFLNGDYSADDPGNQKHEIVVEALALLEKLINQNTDLSLTMIIEDEDINSIFKSSKNCKSYSEFDLGSKQKLHMVGQIIYICAKVSVSSCNKVFENFFPGLVEALELSIWNVSETRHSNAKSPNYGSLYLCIKLLQACRDLTASSENLISQCISANERWCCLLQYSASTLVKIFSSVLATSTDGPTHDVEMCLGVKGMQIMASFPGGYLLISKSVFNNILVTLMSTVSLGFTKTLLWKEALKALVNVGSFICESNGFEKEMGYMDIVVDKIILYASSEDCSMPWPLKSTAISSVGTIGKKFMLKIVQGLEGVIIANLPELYVQGNLKSADIMTKLLDCFSNELLPWIQNNEDFEEVLAQFVLKFWDQIGTCVPFSCDVLEKEEILDATMRTMKLAVAYCSEESQKLIIHKAYHTLSSNTSLKLEIKPTMGADNFCGREKWICSLFASVIIALRPQTNIPNTGEVLYLLMSALHKGCIPASQALGSMINKLNLKSNETGISGYCTFEEALDIIFSSNLLSSFSNGTSERSTTSFGDEIDLNKLLLGASKSPSLQFPVIAGLAWIGKGLLMRGNEKVKDITIILVKCLVSDDGNQELHHSLMKSAADAFQILLSDSELCLNRDFHAIIRPLYKQRFYSSMMPILYNLIVKSDSSYSRSMLYRALAHVINETPLIVVLNDSKKLIPVLVDGLSLLCKDILQKDIVYGLLLVLSGILTDKNGQEVVVENAHIIIKCLIELVAYPYSMLVRETAIQCLAAMSQLPYTRIYPARIQVLQAVVKALDDPKRAVRQEAVKCRQAWASITSSRSLHH